MHQPTTTMFATPDPEKTEPFEVGRVQWLHVPTEEGGRAGYWFVSPEDAPEPTVVIGQADEAICIIEGRIRLESEHGGTRELTAGASAFLTRGTPITWTVLEPTVEFFVYS